MMKGQANRVNANISWVDQEVNRCVAGILAYNDNLKDFREKELMRRTVLDQLELLRHRICIHLGSEPSYVLDVPEGKVRTCSHTPAME
jgi:hypothetical protein